MNSAQQRLKIPIIAGPTGAGKTLIADELCGIVGGEIISADSRQVYRLLDIGTNKTKTSAPQHLVDLIDIDKRFSAGDFFAMAKEKIAELLSRKKIPVIVGGSGLYIRTLLEEGLDELPRADWELRDELAKLGCEELFRQLKKVDPDSAEVNKKNPQRMIRALEIYLKSGKPASELLVKKNKPSGCGEYLFTAINISKNMLYDRIAARSRIMLESGMIEETLKALEMGFPRNSPGFEGIGYSDVFAYIDGKISKTQLIELIFSDTKKYIKRQFTWFKRQKGVTWITVDNLSAFQTAEIISSRLLLIPA